VKKDNKLLNSTLRQKAEELLKRKVPAKVSDLSGAEVLKLLHELEVHKLELELQIEELVTAKEKALSDARKYSELYDFAPSGYITLSREGAITEINIHGAQMLDKERSLLIEKRFCSFLIQESRPLFQLFLKSVFQSKVKETCVVSLMMNTAIQNWIHISAQVNSDEEFCNMIVVDISEQRNAEEILQDIIENNPMSIQIVDRNGFTLNTNSAHTRLFGAVPPPDFSIFHDLQSKDPALKDLIQQSRDGEVVHFPDILYNPHNASSECPDVQLWIRAVLFPLKNNERDPDRFVLMHENITERKQNEAAILFRNILLSTLQDVSIDGILVVDENRRILFYNKQFVEMWGIPAKLLDDGIDEPVLHFVAEQIAEKLDFLQKALYLVNHRHEISRDELVLKNGRIFDRYTAPMIGEGEQYFGRVWYFRDITEAKQAEKELISSKRKAEESDQLKTAFLQNISHEIRTPLNSILGFSKLLNKPDIPEDKLKQFSGIIIKSSEQLLTIVNDIITISSLETGQEKLTLHKFCVNDLISDLLTIFTMHPARQKVSIDAKQQVSDKESEITTDKGKLIQILSNLLINALKFTHQGFVEFGYNIEDDNFVFYVKDTGIGIKPEMQEVVFDRFRQGDSTISTEYGGTGLGLAISKGFTELMGGKIWVESEPGKGSTFYFTIPAGQNRQTK